MKAQLDAWGAELHELESRAEHARADLKERYRRSIEELRDKQAAAENKLREIEHAGEETREDIKDEIERVWAAFKASLDAFRDFSDHS
jgi:membrane protein involved in colicin uptake